MIWTLIKLKDNFFNDDTFDFCATCPPLLLSISLRVSIVNFIRYIFFDYLGDYRVNTHPQLAVIHTIWHREHNRIADKLAELNPNWSDETLFQEARRIVIAEIQHITYKEWLPILLGKRYTRAVGLVVGNSYSRNYNSEDDPAISNEVATAALRFLTSLMQGKIR